MIKLSVVIITFNEERNIARCLKSVEGIADDIVVVDSYSSDKTIEIVSAFGARIIQHSFEGHIQQKNWAITQAKYPLILSLDADEALSDELKKSIAEVKNNWQFNGYKMNRLTNYCGKWIRHCGWYPDTKLRLWDSRLGEWKGINPHDEYVMNNNEPVGFLKGDILHYSYYSLEDHYRQVNYFTDIASKAYFEKGMRVSVLKLYISPLIKFTRDYFIKGGILDGYYGFVISKISAYATFLKYKKLRNLQHNNK